MIRELRIRNFMSIRDEQVLTFEATKDDTARELLTVEVRPNLRLNRMAILYGANASGKSNVLYAYDTVWRMLTLPFANRLQAIPFFPFALERENPTRLSVSFFVADVRYDYSVEYDARHILAEKMEYAPNGVMSLFYDRRFMDDSLAPPSAVEMRGDVVLSPAPGKVKKLCVAQGSVVRAGDVIVVLDAMHMETPVVAPKSGTIEYCVQVGDSKSEGDYLCLIK